ncbi:hypothetical protein G6F56_011011 [Rhizopus delemar]|uniref:Uncharacterized protein n=1 Tax=Rhizopus stolonifer TaxID=4846 RepID=A0A367IK50_RHIST|nr:hypothetical protein G6F56_011011 [Rhizopus delemar]RCH78062.1 hypothetical protein CU098_002010 [Rhizopus stolonifer]
MFQVLNQEEIHYTQVDPVKNYHAIVEEEIDQEDGFNFLGQQPNIPEYEVAKRTFYATLDKITSQNGPDTKRRSSHSFLKSWHLHRTYSKTQQTLLGLNPVNPSVILCGDDFIFTPPFVPQQEGAGYFETTSERQWNVQESNLTISGLASDDVSSKFSPFTSSLYTEQKYIEIQDEGTYSDPLSSTHLLRAIPSSSPQSSQEIVVLDNDPFELFDEFYSITTTADDDQEQSIVFSSSSSSDSSSDSSSISSESDDEMDNKRRSFYADDEDDDEYKQSSYDDLMNLYDTTLEIEPSKDIVTLPVTRSSTYLSENSYLTAQSVVSYESLADIIRRTDHASSSLSLGERSSHVFGKIMAWADPDSGEEGLLSRFIVYVVSIWDTLSSLVLKPSSSEPALIATDV